LRYYTRYPNDHAYTQPEIPAYDRQMMVRDRILERYPRMIVVGAHLGCMMSNLEEVAKRLDKFPNFYVDLSGCFGHIFVHAIQNRNCLIDFFETYQNRILFGTDWYVSKYNKREWMNYFCKYFPKLYMELLFRYMCHSFKKHWLLLSTDQTLNIGKVSTNPEYLDQIKGIKLTKRTVDRIFYENARFVYSNESRR
jgi:hypothetical protein